MLQGERGWDYMILIEHFVRKQNEAKRVTHDFETKSCPFPPAPPNLNTSLKDYRLPEDSDARKLSAISVP